MLYSFIKGFILSLSVSFTIGPVFLTIVNIFLKQGSRSGFAAAIAVSIVDSTYIVLSVCVMSILKEFMEHAWYLSLIGFIFLIYLGIKFLRQNTINSIGKKTFFENPRKVFVFMITFAFCSPMTFLCYSTIFAPFALNTESSLLLVIGGVISTFIFYISTGVILTYSKDKINQNILLNLTKLGGLMIFIFGSIGLLRLCSKYIINT